jgi:predicted phosphodiesterase
MRIKIFSDIHLEHSYPGQYFDPGKGDVLILAGDILCAHHLNKNGYLNDIYRKFISDCSEDFETVLYVKGNHEAFSSNYEGAHKTIKSALPDNFHLLENDTVKIGNTHFLGFTLWTNFFNEDPFEMMDAQSYMGDYSSIRIGSNYRKLNTNDTLGFHKNSINYLNSKLQELKDERVFVISHHCPTLQGIAPQFKNSRCNGSFCSDLDNLILANTNIKNWVSGHVHTPYDFNIGQCRMSCNPRGYPGEKTRFNPNFFIDIPE